MKKYLLSMAAILLLSPIAQAAPVNYTLESVTYGNPFAGTAPVTSCTGCGSATAVEDGGAITLTGIAWDYGPAAGNQYSISFDGTTTLAAGTSLLKTGTPTCTAISGALCDPASVLSGIAGNFYTGFGNDNSTACSNDRCRVDVSLVSGDLVIVFETGMSESLVSSRSNVYTMTFAAVPIPAAVWLFGSALGGLGWMRRRAAV
jgi:hypothetical protein